MRNLITAGSITSYLRRNIRDLTRAMLPKVQKRLNHEQ